MCIKDDLPHPRVQKYAWLENLIRPSAATGKSNQRKAILPAPYSVKTDDKENIKDCDKLDIQVIMVYLS